MAGTDVADAQPGCLRDANGFLVETGSWNRSTATRIAETLGIRDLTLAHWAILWYLRRHYLVQGTLPWEAHVCRELGMGKGCIHSLFGGPLTAWQVAGLPNPGEEARAYLLSLELPRDALAARGRVQATGVARGITPDGAALAAGQEEIIATRP
jgi:tRNA 2-thiouridine synthesizing protein E